VTRSHKWNDKTHGDGATIDREVECFGSKAGGVDGDSKKTKKDGAGRASW